MGSSFAKHNIYLVLFEICKQTKHFTHFIDFLIAIQLSQILILTMVTANLKSNYIHRVVVRAVKHACV